MYFPKRVLLPIIRSRFISKKKRNFYPDNYPSFHRSNIHENDLSRHTYLTFSRISSLEKWIARRLIAAPPQRDIRGFETSTAIKRIIAGGFFFSGWKREERKKKGKNASVMASRSRARVSPRQFTRQGFAHREKTRENVRVHPKFAQGSCSVKNSPVCRRGS